jgi:hypothetical protein
MQEEVNIERERKSQCFCHVSIFVTKKEKKKVQNKATKKRIQENKIKDNTFFILLPFIIYNL